MICLANMSDAKKPTTKSLRSVLFEVLVSDSDLEAFCLDYFPSVKRRFANGMDRTQKLMILVESEDPADILGKLAESEPRRFARFQHLLQFDTAADEEPTSVAMVAAEAPVAVPGNYSGEELFEFLCALPAGQFEIVLFRLRLRSAVLLPKTMPQAERAMQIIEMLEAEGETGLPRLIAAISKTAPAFSAVLRTYRRALAAGDGMLADGLISWLAGQPNVAASIKRAAGIKGDLDHFGATNFLVGLLTILRDSGFSGLVMVLDEVETLQRMRTDTRERGLNALRQWIDEIDAGRYPGLYLVITGTPAFYDGPQGVQRLAPLAQRLHVDFGTDRRFDNPRAVQIRLAAFDHTSLLAVGRRVRDIYADGRPNEQRLRAVVDDSYLDALARAVAGGLGGKVGVAPRLFLKKLVSDVLDRVDLHEDFDPRKHYTLTLAETEMSATERAAASAASVDDIEL